MIIIINHLQAVLVTLHMFYLSNPMFYMHDKNYYTLLRLTIFAVLHLDTVYHNYDPGKDLVDLTKIYR